MKRKKFRILLIDDDEDYFLLIRGFLSHLCEQIQWISSYEKALEQLDHFKEYDAVLVDYRLGNKNGLEIIQKSSENPFHSPMILLTGMENSTVDNEALYAGASDYLSKGEITAVLLERTIRYAVQHADNLKAITRMEDKFRALIQNSSDLVQIIDEKGKIIYESPSVKKILGYLPGERLGQFFQESLHPQDQEKISQFMEGLLVSKKDRYPVIEYRVRDKDQGWVFMESVGSNALNDSSVNGLVLNSRDITERKETEKKLHSYTVQMEEDLRAKQQSLLKAQAIQQKLNTRFLPDTEDIALLTCYMPSEELGGDYFNIWKDDDRLLILIADCTGHGIDAAMDSVLVKSVADRYTHLLLADHPELFLHEVNNDMIDYFEGQNFFTMFAGVLNLNTKIFTYANANSELPYLKRGNRVERLARAEGFHIGFQKNYPYEVKTLTLSPEDLLFLSSDSLREILLPGGAVWGNQGVEQLVSKFGKGLLNDFNLLLSELNQLNGRLPLKDDTTLIMLSFQPVYQKSFQSNTQDGLNRIEDLLTLEMENRGFSPDEIQRVRVSYEEMATNALTHGNKNDPSKQVSLAFWVDCSQVLFSIRDEGEGFNPEKVPDPTDIRRIREWMEKGETEKYTHGRGIFLTRKYMDHISYNEKGNQVNLAFNREHRETFFLYFGEESQESLCCSLGNPEECHFPYVWDSGFDVTPLMLSSAPVQEIEFPETIFLSSEDLKKFFILYQDSLKKRKLLKVFFASAEQAQILAELNLAQESVLEIYIRSKPDLSDSDTQI